MCAQDREKEKERERGRERKVYVCMVCNRSMRNTSLVVTEYSYMCVSSSIEKWREEVWLWCDNLTQFAS